MHTARSVWPVIVLVFCAVAEAVDFSRYQVILDRKPFGEVQLPKEVVQPVAPPPSTLTKTLRMCAITEDSNGRVQVGILDLAAKPPQSYFLTVGEIQDGIELVDASYEEEKAVVRKGGEECTLQLESGTGQPVSGAVGGAAPPVSLPVSASPIAPPSGTPAVRAVTVSPAGAQPGSSGMGTEAAQSYAERLRARREALRQRVVEGPRLSGEELKKHLEEYQMELIRAKGAMGPPLPIQLTPEMDAQLVSEGVLPPNSPTN